jgi:hypothetical protein
MRSGVATLTLAALILGVVAAMLVPGRCRPTPGRGSAANQGKPPRDGVAGKKAPARPPPRWAPAALQSAGDPADPRSPNFDIEGGLARHGHNLRSVFEADVRDEAWASALEPRLTEKLTEDLGRISPKITNISVECRSAGCHLGYQAPPELERQVLFVLGMLYHGSAYSGDRREGGLIVFYRGNSRLFPDTSPDGVLAIVQRNHTLPFRDGNVPPHFLAGAPRELWPVQQR